MSDIIKINLAKAPGWFIAALEEAKICLAFDWVDLSKEQKAILTILNSMAQLVNEGIIEVQVKEGKVGYRMTPLGTAYFEEMQKRRAKTT